MADMLGVEPIMDELKAQLQASLPAKIAALQPTFAPVIPMPDVAEWAVGKRTNFVAYPAVSFVDDDSTVEEDNIRWQSVDHLVALLFYVTSGDEESLHRLVARYVRCLRETLQELRFNGAFTFKLRFAGAVMGYSPRDVAGPELFLGGAVLPLIAHKKEVHP
jgi:hypothetical protein